MSINDQPPVPAQAPPAQEPNQDLAGFQTPDDLARAYRASSNEARKLKERADQAERLLQMQMRPEVPQRDAFQRLTDYGIPADDLRQAVTDVVRQEFEPVVRGMSARSRVLRQYPDYNKFESDVAGFIDGDADLSSRYQRMFQADPEGAMEFAFLKFGESRRASHQPPAETSGRERSDAQIPSATRGESRREDRGDTEDLQRAFKHYQDTGDARPFAKARFKRAIPDDFFNR